MSTFEAGLNPKPDTRMHLLVEKFWMKLGTLVFADSEKLHNF